MVYLYQNTTYENEEIFFFHMKGNNREKVTTESRKGNLHTSELSFAKNHNVSDNPMSDQLPSFLGCYYSHFGVFLLVCHRLTFDLSYSPSLLPFPTLTAVKNSLDSFVSDSQPQHGVKPGALR